MNNDVNIESQGLEEKDSLYIELTDRVRSQIIDQMISRRRKGVYPFY